MNSEQLARQCAESAAEKKAEDILLLDLRGISSFTDWFVLCNGTSEPHLKAIVSEIRSTMREQHGLRPAFADGMPASQWVVLDYGEVLVHAFTPDRRAHYALESLWGDAKRIRLDEEEKQEPTAEKRPARKSAEA